MRASPGRADGELRDTDLWHMVMTIAYKCRRREALAAAPPLRPSCVEARVSLSLTQLPLVEAVLRGVRRWCTELGTELLISADSLHFTSLLKSIHLRTHARRSAITRKYFFVLPCTISLCPAPIFLDSMGVKLPPIWRARKKACAKHSTIPQPPSWLVVPLRITIELVQQLIFTFAAVQIVLSFSVGFSLFDNLRKQARFDQGLPSGHRCPPGVHNLMREFCDCAPPSYMNHPDGFMGWLSNSRDDTTCPEPEVPTDSNWPTMLFIMISFFFVSIGFTVALTCMGGGVPDATGDSVAGSLDVATCYRMMLNRRSRVIKYTKHFYLAILYLLVLGMVVSLGAFDADGQGLVAYILFRNVNALLMFFLQPIFFWYPPRYGLSEWADFKSMCEAVHARAETKDNENAGYLSARLSVWHTIMTPAEDVVNKVVAELGTAKTMCEDDADDTKEHTDDGPAKGSKRWLQYMFAQKSGVSILLGVYMMLTAITQYEAAQYVGPPAAPPPAPPVQPPGYTRLCDDTCVLRDGQSVTGCVVGQPCTSQVMNGVCSDGLDGTERTCEVGTDCSDCSYRDVAPPPPPPSYPPATPGQGFMCANTCLAAQTYASCTFGQPCTNGPYNNDPKIANGFCDEFTTCLRGTDCADCGPAYIAPPSPPPVPFAPPPPPPLIPPAGPGIAVVCENTCLAQGLQNVMMQICQADQPCTVLVADGMCQDGSDPSFGRHCHAGTDCADCGPSYVASPSPPPTPRAPPPPPPMVPPGGPGETVICTNTCDGRPGTIDPGVPLSVRDPNHPDIRDGRCQDGSAADVADPPTFNMCALGTDCGDCGAYYVLPSVTHPPPPDLPYPPSPPPRTPADGCCDVIEAAFTGGAAFLTNEQSANDPTFSCMGIFEKHPTLTNEGRAVYINNYTNTRVGVMFYTTPDYDRSAFGWYCAEGDIWTNVTYIMKEGERASYNLKIHYGDGCSCPTCSSPGHPTPSPSFRIRTTDPVADSIRWSDRSAHASVQCFTRAPPAAPPPLDTSSCCDFFHIATGDVVPVENRACFEGPPFRKTATRSPTGRNVYEKEGGTYLWLDEETSWIWQNNAYQTNCACRAAIPIHPFPPPSLLTTSGLRSLRVMTTSFLVNGSSHARSRMEMWHQLQ